VIDARVTVEVIVTEAPTLLAVQSTDLVTVAVGARPVTLARATFQSRSIA